MKKLKRLSLGLLPHRLVVVHTMLLLLCSFVIFTAQAAAVVRFTERSLFLYDTSPGVTTKYRFSLTYTTPAPVGSLDMLFCSSPIPDDPCVPPPGLDVSGAVLSQQDGVTGYSILQKSVNHIVLTRNSDPVGQTPSTYYFDNMVNPTNTGKSFAVRLSDYSSTDASGPIIDLGSVLSAPNIGITIETQVPPMLIFCVGGSVSPDCSNITGGWYTDMGNLDPNQTLKAVSQMAAGTNASGGYVITANGPTLSAGLNTIKALTVPTVSAPGNSQFGINLRANSNPAIGDDPDGDSTNANAAPGYATPNQYMYKDGDVVASAPNVSLVRRFTVSYIVNSPANLHAGVYTTTLTYICSGRF